MSRRHMLMLRAVLSDKNIQKMRSFAQHGAMNTYEHCVNVSIVAIRIGEKLRLKEYKFRNLVVGGMLHDFYLYDYHGARRTPGGLHAFAHPGIALRNALRIFDLNERQRNIITSHMFPATISKIPRYAEAWIVCAADKYCAARELAAGKKGWRAA